MSEYRGWGHTALFVDNTDIMPRNITAATMEIPQFSTQVWATFSGSGSNEELSESSLVPRLHPLHKFRP